MNRQAELFTIQDMGCQHCVITIKSALEKIPGVEINSIEIGSVRLTFDIEKTNREELVRVIEGTGFTVS